MRKLIDFMMTQPLLTGIVGIFVAMFSIHNCNTVGDALSEGTLRMLLSGTMAFFLYFVSSRDGICCKGIVPPADYLGIFRRPWINFKYHGRDAPAGRLAL